MGSTQRQEAKEATRVLVTEAAARMFRELGYEPVTIRGVAQSIGRSTGSVFNVFSNKAEMFETVTGRYPPDDKRIRAFIRLVAACHEGDSLADTAKELETDLYGAAKP